MTNQSQIRIRSEEDLKKNSTSILKRINNAERGGLLFLLNPVFALQDIEIDLSLPMRSHIRRALRYGSETKKELKEMESEINKLAGYKVNVISNTSVSKLLFDDLKLPIPKSSPKQTQADTPAAPDPVEYEPETDPEETTDINFDALEEDDLRDILISRGIEPGKEKSEMVGRLTDITHTMQSRVPITIELLESLKEKHPVVPKLIEMRKLLKTGWRFVNREIYDKVKAGASVTLLKGVSFRNKK